MKNIQNRLFLITIFCAVFMVPLAVAHNPPELGTIVWNDDFSHAQALAKKEDKPLLVLFQEVPGCATCQFYGNEALSSVLVKEAAESLFVPVAVYNNSQEGTHRQTLKSFDEPSSNNPVVRIMDPDRKMLYTRITGDYTKAGLLKGMISALENYHKPVPEYLKILYEEELLASKPSNRAIFTMFCFWKAEGLFGTLKGVKSTVPGYIKGAEAVLVEYAPDIISRKDLERIAKNGECKPLVYKETEIDFKKDKEPKFHLEHSLYKFVPMTQLQILRVNSVLEKGDIPDTYLSPKQLKIYDAIKKYPSQNWIKTIETPFEKAWEATIKTYKTATFGQDL